MSTQDASSFIETKRAQFSRELERQKSIGMKDQARQGSHHWVREAWTFRVQSNLPEKVLVIERLRLLRQEGNVGTEGGARAGDVEYRSATTSSAGSAGGPGGGPGASSRR